MMKRFLTAALAVILTMSLAACGDNNSAKLPNISGGDTSVLGTDFQKNMNQSTSLDISSICETKDGYYFQYNCMVYYVDKETGDSTVLCGKPDCDHTHSEGKWDCNAFVSADFLTYYNGKLYYNNGNYVLENGSYVNKGERLFSMNLDGTEHDVVQDLDFVPGGDTNSFVTAPMIHRGNVYFCYSGALYTAELGADIEDATLIYGEQKVDDGSMIVNPYEMYYELWADGELIYFMAKNVRQADGTYKDTLYSYNSQNDKLDKIWQVPDKTDVGAWDTTGVSVSQWYVSNGYIYFYLSGNDIWYTELSTGETNKLIDLNLEAGAATFSNEYIAVVNKEYNGFTSFTGESSVTGGDTLYVYDYNGKLVNEISLEQIYKDCDTVSACNILCVNDGKVYIHTDATITGIYSESFVSNTIQEHYLYVVDIGSGQLEKTGWSYYHEY